MQAHPTDPQVQELGLELQNYLARVGGPLQNLYTKRDRKAYDDDDLPAQLENLKRDHKAYDDDDLTGHAGSVKRQKAYRGKIVYGENIRKNDLDLLLALLYPQEYEKYRGKCRGRRVLKKHSW